MNIIWGILGGIFGLLIVIDIFQLREIKDLQQELASQQGLAQSWQEKANAASAAQLAISEQAQACLDRESQREKDDGLWLEILEQSQSRDMNDKEKGNVPDDKIRNALLDALDKPL